MNPSDPNPPDPADLASFAGVDGEPPVPVTVWHVTDLRRRGETRSGDEFSPALAGLLVALYTRPGDTVVALGHDPALAGAAGAQGCTYVAVDDPADLADLDAVAGTVRLIVVPPRTTHRIRHNTAAAVDLFTACRTLTVPAGCTIVALATLPTGATAYTDLTPLLIPAARQAGLEWLRHIVAVTGALTDTPESTCTPAEAGVSIHVDLLVLSVRQDTHG
ncbi:hypothetical protein GCM10009557_00650 [Virgisporangium ochraceum]|uniref:Uncharacterized protein n=1 Tax=Virgisporangium ochraceum TaxID=65505 RepID=A0A8J4EJB0_9ACTN|nr:hypothetical protein [Virgisporangium ochraceum]GIJ74097.1 hypothetical protein Voc01_090140 [Virgisporangium ochraceum]